MGLSLSCTNSSILSRYQCVGIFFGNFAKKHTYWQTDRHRGTATAMKVLPPRSQGWLLQYEQHKSDMMIIDNTIIRSTMAPTRYRLYHSDFWYQQLVNYGANNIQVQFQFV